MENKSNNTEKILADKLSLDHFAPHSPELQARVMMAVSRRARRRATLHTIRNVALGVVVAVAVLALVGGAMVLAMKFLGLEDACGDFGGWRDDLHPVAGGPHRRALHPPQIEQILITGNKQNSNY